MLRPLEPVGTAARIGLGMWQHGIDRPEAREHGLGWSNAASYAESAAAVSGSSASI